MSPAELAKLEAEATLRPALRRLLDERADLLAAGATALRALREMHGQAQTGVPVVLDRGAFDALEAAIAKARGGK